MPTTFANTIDGNDIYAKRAECDAAGNDLSTTYATKAELPAIVGLTAGSNVTITEGQDSITISATDTTYSAGTGLSLTGTTFSNSDPLPAHTSTESGKVLGVDSNGDLGWVNQSGGGGSYSAGNGIDITNDVISVDTSVVATKTDLAGKEDAFDVGTGLEMDTSGATPTLQVEAPVDIVAGPGIVIDNPDGNTLRVSVAQNVETVLFESANGVQDNITLSENIENFEFVRVEWCPYTEASNWTAPYDVVTTKVNGGLLHLCGAGMSDNTTYQIQTNLLLACSAMSVTVSKCGTITTSPSVSKTSALTGYKIFKVVGIHRIAGGN